MKFIPLLLFICLFFSGSLLRAQIPASSRDVNFQISLTDGKTAYRIGEPINLGTRLVFIVGSGEPHHRHARFY